MRKLFNLLLSASLLLAAGSVGAIESSKVTSDAEDNYAALKKNLKTNLPDLAIDRIVTTPFTGVYEVDSGRKIFYVDHSGNYALVGNLLDLTTKSSLTQARSEALSQIDWQQLPLDLAIRRTLGKGTNRIAIFTDPDCPFCQRLETETVPKLQDVTIYYYLYPLTIHAHAALDSKQILCAENPEIALVGFMSKGQALGKNSSCNNANKLNKMLELGNNLIQVNGTPTIVLPNGRIMAGLVPADYLNRMIATNRAESAN